MGWYSPHWDVTFLFWYDILQVAYISCVRKVYFVCSRAFPYFPLPYFPLPYFPLPYFPLPLPLPYFPQ